MTFNSVYNNLDKEEGNYKPNVIISGIFIVTALVHFISKLQTEDFNVASTSKT
jgi:hypothetical protein